MKTKFKLFSTLLILTLLISSIQIPVFATSAVDLYGLQPGTEEQNPTIAIKDISVAGKEILVTGQINTGKNQITCSVTASNGEVAYDDQKSSNEKGAFSFSFLMPDWATAGTYTVKCTGDGQKTQRTFKLQVLAKTNKTLSITKKTVNGDSVTISGTTPQNNQSIAIVVSGTDASIVHMNQTVSDSNNNFTFSFLMPDWATTGTYTIKVNVNGSYSPITDTFIYNKIETQTPVVDENQESNIKLVINNRNIVFPDQQPLLIDDRTYVPVRFLAENLGAKVEWDDRHQVVIITNNGIQLTETVNEYARYYLRIGEPQMVYVAYNRSTNYPTRIEIFDLPQAPFVTSKGRTMLPFRFVSELLGAFIYYDANTSSAIAEYNPNKKIQTIYPVPILSTLVQDAFHTELMDFRLKNKPEEIKNPQMMNVVKSDTLMAAATWKTFQLFDKYDHENPDGTLYWSRFFSLYLPNTSYKFSGENIKTTRFAPPVGIQLINASSHVSGQYYYCMEDVDGFLDDSEYWYNHLADAWGINMVPLTETSDLVYNGKSYSKYKMNSQHYLKVSGVNFHSFSIIQHWNEDVYRSYMKQEIVSWGNSFGHRSNLLSPSGKFGYGVRLINSRGYSTYAKGQ